MRNKILFFCVMFLFIGCKQEDKYVASLFLKWQDKEIIFPNAKQLYSLAGDLNAVVGSKYFILNYVDSAGCLSCNLRFQEWNILLKEFRDERLDIMPVFIVYPGSDKRIRELEVLARTNAVEFPLLIDTLDAVSKLNIFPNDVRFHTFLLDEHHKVLAIGNPVLNPKVKELYLKIIQGGSLQEEDTASDVQTTVSTSSTVLSLGTFPWQEEQSDTFTLTNTGDAPLLVQDVITSCGCLSVDYPREPVRSGGEAVLRVRYKADNPGYFSKSVTVYSNAEGSPLKLTVSGVGE